MINLTRKGFVRLMVYGLGGAALGSALPGCGSASGTDAGTGGGGGTGGGATGGGSGGGGGSATGCAANGAEDTAISFNHGHALIVPAADFTASGDKTYAITGTSLHSHAITLTQAQRSTLAGGQAVTVTSTLGDGHTHDVTVGCA